MPSERDALASPWHGRCSRLRIAMAAPTSADPPKLDELFSDALANARDVLRAEVALARQELREEATSIKLGLAVGLFGLLLLQAALLCLAVAIVLALGASTSAAWATGALLFLLGGATLGVARAMLSRRHMLRTRARLLPGEESARHGN